MKQNNKYKQRLFIGLMLTMLSFVLSSQETFAGNSTFPGVRLTAACQNYILSKVKDDAQVTISREIEDVIFNEDGVSAKCVGKAASFRGNCFVVIEFYKNGNLIKRLEIPVRVKLFREVPKVVSSLPRAKEISESDIIFEKTDITNYRDEDLLGKNEVIGAKLKRNISEGTVITRAFIEEEMTISRGEKIVIISESGAVRIRTSGEALQDGVVGKTIRIRREGTRSVLHGCIARDGTVFIK